MHLRNIWAIIILSLCMVPAFGQGALIKGLEQARTIASLTERIAYLRNLNPTVPISSIKSAARGLAAKPPIALSTAEQTTPKNKSFIQLPKRPRTGLEIYTHFSLRDKLSATKLFTAKDLDLVEQAVKNTDAIFYRQTGKNVSLLTQGWEAVAEPWNYLARFQTELYTTFPQMSPKQRIVFTAERGPSNFLHTYGQLLSLQNYILYDGKLPTSGHPLYRAAQKRIQSEKKDPISIEMIALFNQYRATKTSQQWLREYAEHPEQFTPDSPMYLAFVDRAYRVKKALAAGKEVDEASLQMAQIYWDNTERFKTPEEWLAAYANDPNGLIPGSIMHKAFQNKYEQVKDALQTGKKIDDASLQMYDIYISSRQNKTPEDWLAEYEKHPDRLRPGTPMYSAFQMKVQQVNKALAAGKTVDSASLQMRDVYINTRQNKTPKQWIERYKKHREEFRPKTPMYIAFQQKAQQVKAALEDGKDVDAASLQMAQIFWDNTKRFKTPEEWLQQYRDNQNQLTINSSIYHAFREKSYQVAAKQKAGEKIDEASLQMANIYWEHITHPDTPQEVYNMLLSYLRVNHAYPSSRAVEYRKVYNRLYGKSLAEIKADPDLYKLYRLDQLARAVLRGEKPWEVFDRDNPLRRERINQQQGQTSQQASAEELKQTYEQLSPDEQQALRNTEEHYDQLWQNYPVWFEENKGNIIFTRQTTAAFDLLNKQVAAGRSSEEIISTLDMLQQLSLGNVGDGVFNRVIYRGNNATLTPRAEDFHLVIEEQGLPSLPHIRQMFPQEVPHVYFKFMDGKISVMGLTTGVTPQDIETAIDTLLEHISQNAQVSNASDGWRIRMGKHEMSDKPHIHFEFVDGEEGMDLSYVLRLDVRGVIPEEKNARKKTFEYLFGKYIER